MIQPHCDVAVVEPVAFLGLGIMGLPMAGHLAAAGIRLRLWNRSTARTAMLAGAATVTVAARAADAVEGARVVIVMLSTGAVVDATLFDDGPDGRAVADVLQPGATIVVMSSIPVEVARSQAERLAIRGIHYVDAPVSGGERGAIAGRLAIMAGGSEQDVATVTPLLARFGSVTRVGPVGTGQIAKLANQLIVGVTIGAVAESLLLATAGGADPAAVLQALQGGFADSPVLRQHGQRMVMRSFEPGAHATTQLKDLATARALAATCALELPFLALAEELYRSACAHGCDGLDHSALFLELERASRVMRVVASAPPTNREPGPRSPL